MLSLIIPIRSNGAAVDLAMDFEMFQGADMRNLLEELSELRDSNTFADFAQEDADGKAVLNIIRNGGDAAEAEAFFQRNPRLLDSSCGAYEHLNRPLLSFAAACGNVAMVECLLAHGADVEERDCGHIGSGKTSLLHAAEAGSLPVVKLLCEQHPGIDIDVGGGAIMLSPQMVNEGCDESDLKEYMGQDGDWNDDGWTALMHAAKNDDMPMLLYLLSRGANPEICSRFGRSAADLATDTIVPQLLALAKESRRASETDTTRPVLEAIPTALQSEALRLMLQHLPERCKAPVLTTQLCLRNVASSEGRHLDAKSQEHVLMRYLCTSLFR